MELFYILLVLLLVTRVFGEVAARFAQPVLVGELLGGVILGVFATVFSESLPVLANLSHNEVFKAITELGIFFLMLLAGIEMRPKDLTTASGSAAAVALGGMALPLALGIGLGWLWLPESDWRFAQMLFIGVALSVTAVPITIAALMDLESRGRTWARSSSPPRSSTTSSASSCSPSSPRSSRRAAVSPHPRC